MKTYSTISILFFWGIFGVWSAIPVWANVVPIIFTTAGIQLASEERIQLTQEHIAITLHSYESLNGLRFQADYDCILYFENLSDEKITHDTIFPFQDTNRPDPINYFIADDEILDYTVRVNHQDIPFTIEEEVFLEEAVTFPVAALSQITFPPNTTTVIHFNYSLVSRDTSAYAIIVQYLFSTGKRWGATSTICDINVSIDPALLPYLYIIEPAGFQFVAKERLEWHKVGLPDQDLYLEFYDDYHLFSHCYTGLAPEDGKLLGKLLYTDESHTLFVPDNQLETILTQHPTNPRIKKFLLCWLGRRYAAESPAKAIIFLKQLAELPDYKEAESMKSAYYSTLHHLSECLLSQAQFPEAIEYLHILAHQKEYPGFSLYAQYILQEHQVLKGPFDVEFTQKKKWLEGWE